LGEQHRKSAQGRIGVPCTNISNRFRYQDEAAALHRSCYQALFVQAALASAGIQWSFIQLQLWTAAHHLVLTPVFRGLRVENQGVHIEELLIDSCWLCHEWHVPCMRPPCIVADPSLHPLMQNSSRSLRRPRLSTIPLVLLKVHCALALKHRESSFINC